MRVFLYYHDDDKISFIYYGTLVHESLERPSHCGLKHNFFFPVFLRLDGSRGVETYSEIHLFLVDQQVSRTVISAFLE